MRGSLHVRNATGPTNRHRCITFYALQFKSGVKLCLVPLERRGLIAQHGIFRGWHESTSGTDLRSARIGCMGNGWEEYKKEWVSRL